jgi:hypothetical protein
MLIIRKEQIALFEIQVWDIFAGQIVEKLCTDSSELVSDIDSDTLKKRVNWGIGRAKEYGITWKKNLITFVELMFEISPQFDTFGTFKECLNDESRSPNERVSLMLERTSVAEWEEAKRELGDQGWPEE